MGELIHAPVAVRTFCTFRVQGRLYAIDVAQVREVSTQVTCAPVPQAPPTIRGLTNLRSRIYLVLDVRPELGLAPEDCTRDSRLLVLKPQVAEDLAVLVDCGGDIVVVPDEQIEDTTRASAGQESALPAPAISLVVGVCKLETELMMILDPVRLVAAVERAMRGSTADSPGRDRETVGERVP